MKRSFRAKQVMTQPHHWFISTISDANALKMFKAEKQKLLRNLSTVTEVFLWGLSVEECIAPNALNPKCTPHPVNECKLFAYDMGHSREHIGFVELMYNASMNYAWLIWFTMNLWLSTGCMSAAPPLGGTVAFQMSSHHGWLFEDYEGETCGPISLVSVHRARPVEDISHLCHCPHHLQR